jgi:hypothetical protein
MWLLPPSCRETSGPVSTCPSAACPVHLERPSRCPDGLYITLTFSPGLVDDVLLGLRRTLRTGTRKRRRDDRTCDLQRRLELMSANAPGEAPTEANSCSVAIAVLTASCATAPPNGEDGASTAAANSSTSCDSQRCCPERLACKAHRLQYQSVQPPQTANRKRIDHQWEVSCFRVGSQLL